MRCKNESFAPGGTDWAGEGAEAAQQQTAVDRKDALRSVDTLRVTATVGEDFSVTDPRSYPPPVAAERQVQAARHSSTITGRVQTLAATDQRVAGQMSEGVFAADFPLDRGPQPLEPAPPVPPGPTPPVTGEPIKLPPPSGPPPVAVIDANLPASAPDQPVDLFPGCDGGEVFWGFGKVVVGGLGIVGGAVAEPFTFGAGTIPIIAGAATLAEGEYDLSQCK